MADGKETYGVHKIAAFLLSLEQEAALELLRELDTHLVSNVAEAMTKLGDRFSDLESVDRLYEDIARRINSRPKIHAPNTSQLQLMLEEAFGSERAAEVMEEMRRRRENERPFEAAETYHPETIGAALAQETPSAAAIVLSHLDPSVSANIISELDPEFALEAVTIMANLTPPGAETLKSIGRNLEVRLRILSETPAPPDPSSRLKTIAEMLNYTSPDMERSVLEGLEREGEDTVTEIREFMFTWKDIAEVDKRAMQKILASVDTRTLAIALKACSAEVEQNVTDNLSSRVKAMVVEERELAGAIPMSEVLFARGELLKAVHALIDSGEFQPSRGGEEMVS